MEKLEPLQANISFLLYPNNVRKTNVFWRFLGVYKLNTGVK